MAEQDVSYLLDRIAELERLWKAAEHGVTGLRQTLHRERLELGARAERAEAAIAVVLERIDSYVAGCCGENRQRFCENYGCVNLRDLAEPLRVALSKLEPPQEGQG